MAIVSDRSQYTAVQAPRFRPSPAHALLIAVSVAYALVVLWRTPQSMSLNFDEVVYASQVARETPAASFYAHRARGTPLLLAPMVTITEWVVGLRVYLLVLAGVLMYVAYRPWQAIFGQVGGGYAYVPVVAAAGFASLWVTVLYGNMAYPNLWLTFAVIAGVGYFCRALTATPRAWPPLVAVAVAFACASLIRPTDALAVAGPLLFVPLLTRGWRRLWPVLAVVAGVVVGWYAWSIEAILRFENPVERWRLSARATGGGLTNAVPANLDALDGPFVLCRPAEVCAGIEPRTAVWWFVLPVLVAAGLVVAVRARWLAAGLVATVTAVAAAVPYLFLLDYAAPRFLLPAYGLLAIPAAGAVVVLAGRRNLVARVAMSALVAAVVLVHVNVQWGVLARVSDQLEVAADQQTDLSQFLRDTAGVRPPCLVWGVGAVQQSYLLKCRPVWAENQAPTAGDPDIEAALGRGHMVLVRFRKDQEQPLFLADWQLVDTPGDSPYVAYLSPE